MARGINRLTAREVATLKVVGRHADGGGLYLRIAPAGSKSWVFMAAHGGKRVEVGLGSAASLSLANARRIAAEMREAITLGAHPRSVLASEAEPQSVLTFAAFADTYISQIESGWKSPVHRQQWRNSLRDHASSLNDKRVDEIGTDDVLAVLRPIWLTKPETAKRVRGRIERILDAAKAHQLRARDSSNPAMLRGHLALLLPKQSKLVRGHHAALPYAEAPAFMAALRERDALAARCLEFTILTAARSGEALGATWGEIDLDAALWTVPKARMKAGAEHVVPLSTAAVDLLEALPSFAERGGNARVFSIAGATRSNMAMTMLLRRMDFGHVTVHGFRSTFRDWAGDATDYARELIEHALAHTIGNKVEAAYRRGTALERRRALMEHWSSFLGTRLSVVGDERYDQSANGRRLDTSRRSCASS